MMVRYRLPIGSTVALFATVCGVAQTAPQEHAPKAAALHSDASPAYAETPDGLQKLLQDLFDAQKTGDATKSSDLYTNLVIPNHSQWFGKTFGQPEGERLESKYNGLLQVSASSLKKRVALTSPLS
jgi:hypothetical protein